LYSTRLSYAISLSYTLCFGPHVNILDLFMQTRHEIALVGSLLAPCLVTIVYSFSIHLSEETKEKRLIPTCYSVSSYRDLDLVSILSTEGLDC
jgi:hypothetical protein